MTEITLTLIPSILISTMDVIMFYYLCHKMIGRSMKLSFKISSIGIVYGISAGLMFNYLDGNTYRIIVTLLLLAILQLTSKKELLDAFVIYGIIFLSVSFVQIPAGLLLMGMLTLDQVFIFLLGQFITFLVIIFLGSKFPFQRLFELISRNIKLKLIMFNMLAFIFISLFYVNYEYSLSYFLYFSILIMLSFLGVYRIFQNLLTYANQKSKESHDSRGDFGHIEYALDTIDDLNELKQAIRQTLRRYGIDSEASRLKAKSYNHKVEMVINKKKNQYFPDSIIKMNLRYKEHNQKVGFTEVLYMLSTLLTNALETRTGKPILIDLYVNESVIELSVANEYEKKGADDFQKIFTEGYSTKATIGRGYGLAKLSEEVKNYGSNVGLAYFYYPEYQSKYLRLSIEIK